MGKELNRAQCYTKSRKRLIYSKLIQAILVFYENVYMLFLKKLQLIRECSAIDTNSTSSFRFSKLTGWDGKHKKISTKISLFTDKEGLPADVAFGKGGADDRDFVPGHLRNGGYRRKIKVLNLDKGYTSCELRRDLRKRGTYVNMQTGRGDYIRKIGPKFRFDEEKYKVRFKVERTHAWMENFRSLKLRREFLPAMFKASVYLVLIIILLRA